MNERLLEAERMLLMGRADAAERIYHAVLDVEPRESIAVVGLARVALERGADHEALDLARRALTIDPANLAARRLATRMAEVLRFRGEDPGRGPEDAAR